MRVVVEANCIFHDIHQENDVGIDAVIEFVKDTKPLAKTIGVQIKSGPTYYDSANNECKIPVGTHRDYWMNYPLPVYGIVYLPDVDCAYWINIKNYLKANPGMTVIRFTPKRLNAFTSGNFTKLILPSYAGELPAFSYQEALDLFQSSDWDEINLGMRILFREHSDKNEVWDKLINFFKTKNVDEIPYSLIYYMAHVPWHGDIVGGRDKITDESREYARSLIESFDKSDTVRLLNLIDENGIERGTMGQSIEALISSLPNTNGYLGEIVHDPSLPMKVRENAALIFAFNNQGNARELQASIKLVEVISNESDYGAMILSHLKEYGEINLY